MAGNVRSEQIKDESIQSEDIKDGDVKRSDLNTSEPGQAVVRKILEEASSNIEIEETGVDEGTGDVTIRTKVPLVPGLVAENQGVEYSLKVKSDLSGYEWIPKDIVVTQNAHGITLTNGVPVPVYLDLSDNWVLAQADDPNTLTAAFVTEVLDINRFVLKVPEGQKIQASSHGLTVGQYYFLSDTVAGGVVVDQPIDRYDDVVFYVLDSNNLILKDNRPRDIETLQKFRSTYTSINTTLDYDGTVYTEVPLGVLVDEDKAGIYLISGNGVQITRQRTYDLRIYIPFIQSGGNDRKRLEGQFFVNGAAFGNPIISQYGRGSNSDAEWKISGELENAVLNIGDVVTFRVRRITSDATGTIFLRAASEATFRIQLK